MLGLLLIVIALIAYGSLYPWQFDFSRHVDPLHLLLHNWPPVDRFLLRDVAINVLLYVPLGVLAVLALRPRRQMRIPTVLAAVALGFVFSASMELLQAYDDHRTTSPVDLATNTLGAFAGALLALIYEPAAASLLKSRGARRLGTSGAVLAVCWAGFQFYPFFPNFSIHRLRVAVSLLAHTGNISPLEMWAGASEWLALALALEAFLGRFRTVWLGALMLCVSMRIFIVTRSLSWNDLLAAGLALALWIVIPKRLRLAAILPMTLSAVLLRELAPFHFSDHPAAFTWIPFGGTLESERQVAVVIMARKAFNYGAAVWLLREAGWSYVRAGAGVAAALFALELLQRYLPGRTPESTDAVLALLMTLALWLADRPAARGVSA